MKSTMNNIKATAVTAITAALLSACAGESGDGVSPQAMADAIHTVLEADRTAYTRLIVNRLANEEKIIKASEQWKEEKALLLPAQMFRAGAELSQEHGADFSYALLSLWPINKQNKPQTEVEKAGLQYVFDNVGENYYGEETLGGARYFTAVYPDVAVADACVTCHNDHKDSPKTDFKLGDVMGGVVIRIPL
jgi:hypothetical protein